MSDKGIQSHINACSHADLYDLEDRTYMRKKDMRIYEHIDFRMYVGLRERSEAIRISRMNERNLKWEKKLRKLDLLRLQMML